MFSVCFFVINYYNTLHSWFIMSIKKNYTLFNRISTQQIDDCQWRHKAVWLQGSNYWQPSAMWNRNESRSKGSDTFCKVKRFLVQSQMKAESRPNARHSTSVVDEEYDLVLYTSTVRISFWPKRRPRHQQVHRKVYISLLSVSLKQRLDDLLSVT